MSGPSRLLSAASVVVLAALVPATAEARHAHHAAASHGSGKAHSSGKTHGGGKAHGKGKHKDKGDSETRSRRGGRHGRHGRASDNDVETRHGRHGKHERGSRRGHASRGERHAAPRASAPRIYYPAPSVRAFTPSESRPPVTILISIDGFRADYLTRGVTPMLSALAAQGISAPMHPAFPAKTFPQHTTLVTGQVPDHHGIVANVMTDPAHPGVTFGMGSTEPYWWEQAEPVWIAAERVNIHTALMFWPGSAVEISGYRPTDWQAYNMAVSNRQRVDGVIDWLRRPAATRPAFVTLYFDTVDTAGHDFGPDSREVAGAVADVDTAIGMLEIQLRQLGQPANLVIVSDHGMAAVSDERVVRLASFANPADYTVLEDGPFATIYPVAGHEAALAASLARAPQHVQCWAKAKIPARFRYGSNARIAPYLCLADVGWQVLGNPPATPRATPLRGAHGYDNAAPEMAALFIAAGPSIKPLGAIPAFDNVDIEPLLRDLIGLPAGKDRDGTDAPFREALGR